VGGDVVRHCSEIERCNQRGGRMLSVVDLLDAGTLTDGLAAYAAAAIGGGASFMVGAVPGGAGKTTVMTALLNFVPAEVELVPADGPASIRRGLARPRPRRCYVCHEIGSGPWYAYLWGPDLRTYFDLTGAGHMLATNLHADTAEQARDQVCGTNAVPQEAFRRMNLLWFLRVGRDGPRRTREIVTVWESDGSEPHRKVFDTPEGGELAPSRLVNLADLDRATGVLRHVRETGARTIREVRRAVLDARAGGERGGRTPIA
jgi:hypothetical protein